MDTSVSYSDLNTAYFSSDEQYWIRRIRKFAKEYPDKVKITRQPEDNFGIIQATIDPRMIVIHVPRKNNVSAEESKRRRDRMIELTTKQREQGTKKVKLNK